MKNAVLLTVLVCGLFMASVAGAQEAVPAMETAPVVQEDANGVDWNEGVITAVGIGAPPPNAVNQAQARGMAKRAATVIARRNLLEMIKGVQIDSATTVKNFMVDREIVISQVRGFLQNSQILDTAYLSDGSVEVTVGVRLHGGLSNLMLPPAASFGPRPMAPPVEIVPEAADEANEEPVAPTAPAVPYTGVIIDARGLGVQPALSPRIVDESGAQVYGPENLSRDYAVKHGMAGYAKAPEKARVNKRVAGNPMEVAAAAISGKGRTDIVLSNQDANAIRNLENAPELLGQARIMILLD